MSHIHIDVEGLSFTYEKNKKDGRKVLRDVSFHANEQDAIGIIGPNGVGKSTLLKLMVGLEEGFTGSIRIEEIPVEKQTMNRIREKVGYVFQDSEAQLFMSTVYEDVAFGPRNFGLPEEEVTKRTMDALTMAHITHLAEKPIYKLSGGEKKLASIATILSMHPDIILMDEPSVALDPQIRRNLIQILNGFDHLKLIASHDLDFIWDTCNRVLLLKDGQIAADGSPDEILRNESLLEQCSMELPLSLTGRN